MTVPREDPADFGFSAAMAELESILAGIENDEVEIDDLAAKVRRAAELIRHARARITEATVEVDRIVAELEE